MARFWEGRRSDSLTAIQDAVLAAPKKSGPRSAIDNGIMNDTDLAEYREVAQEIGVSAQDLLVEEFRIFLAKHDIPVFNLGEVVKYMDEIAARDNPTGYGWQWFPVREKDAQIPLTFGRPSITGYGNLQHNQTASDFYESHKFQDANRVRGHNHASAMSEYKPVDWRTMLSPAYARTIPLHALKKIALVEKNFTGGQVIFAVTDFCIVPHVVVNPDPFLMAVIPNSAVAHGKGRFIIDVWDEPGFGIERMVK